MQVGDKIVETAQKNAEAAAAKKVAQVPPAVEQPLVMPAGVPSPTPAAAVNKATLTPDQGCEALLASERCPSDWQIDAVEGGRVACYHSSTQKKFVGLMSDFNKLLTTIG